MVNVIFGGLLFGYAGWTIYKFVKRSKQGKCAGCSVKDNCSQSDCT